MGAILGCKGISLLLSFLSERGASIVLQKDFVLCCRSLPQSAVPLVFPDSTRLEISRSHVYSRDKSVPVALLGGRGS